MNLRLLLAGALMLFALHAEDAKPPSPRERAFAAWKAGNLTNAVTIISEAIQADGTDARLWNFRAQMRSLQGDHAAAAADLTEAIRVAPGSISLYQTRAIERFRAGQLSGAVADFDEANRLEPKYAPQNWQRGLALFYAGRFDDGRKQFELHRTVNPNDVENAVWHFACVARAENLEAAKKQFMDISGDSRVPMLEVHELFAGTDDADNVLEAANAESLSKEEKRAALFYAHLYLGLYDDLNGRRDVAREHLRRAVELAAPGDFMGDCARLHLQQLSTPPASAPAPAKP